MKTVLADRRLDQRLRASAGDGRAPGHQIAARGVGTIQPRDPGAGQPDAGRQRPDGRFLLRRRLPACSSRSQRISTLAARNVTGGTLGDVDRNARSIQCGHHPSARQCPVSKEAIAVVTGNLGAAGAVMKPSAASPHLLRHTGPAVVFENFADMQARIDSPDLTSRRFGAGAENVGPVGAPACRAGNLPIPKSCSNRACATWCAFPMPA